MDALDDDLRVIASMNHAGVDYVVVGGVAMNLHAWYARPKQTQTVSASAWPRRDRCIG